MPLRLQFLALLLGTSAKRTGILLTPRILHDAGLDVVMKVGIAHLLE